MIVAYSHWLDPRSEQDQEQIDCMKLRNLSHYTLNQDIGRDLLSTIVLVPVPVVPVLLSVNTPKWSPLFSGQTIRDTV